MEHGEPAEPLPGPANHPSLTTWWANRRKQAYISLYAVVAQLVALNFFLVFRVSVSGEAASLMTWICFSLIGVVALYHGAVLADDYFKRKNGG